MHGGHAGHEMSMPMETLDAAAQAARQAKLLADKRESEFNHHLAGTLLILAGVFILAEGSLRRRWPWVRFVWPACFLLASLFLLLYSDTELWPFGPQSWYYGLTHEIEDVQHKIFAVILLGVAFVEIERARGTLKAAWSGWVFPIVAAFGSVLLLFHQHQTTAQGADHMAIMHRVQSQHLAYSITGFGIGLSKGLSEFRITWQSILAKLWPGLMIGLGVLLLLYRE